MPRTTDEQVRSIIDADEDAELTPFIETANELVTEKCAGVVNDDQTPFYTSTRLELIERWLSAHFYSVFDKQVTFESEGKIQSSFENKVDLGLQNTSYGQQALRLDTAGGLAALDNLAKTIKRGKIKILWLGTDDDE